ncbi:competence/damage-inducible protein A [candidate division KSB1 bacterium]
MRAVIIIIGNEILSGRTLDTNSRFLASGLTQLGINVKKIIKIGDSPEIIKKTVEECLKGAELLISSGGLGPTKDDITKKTIAEVFGRKIIVDNNLLEIVEKKFKSFGYKKMPETNISQAEIPEGAVAFPNDRGTAPGLLIKENEKMMIMLPGVPGELEYLFRNLIKPYLEKNLPSGNTIIARTIRTSGFGESKLSETIEPVLEGMNDLEMAYLPATGKVDIRFTSKGIPEEKMNRIFDSIKAKILPLIGRFVYGYDDEDQVENLGKMLSSRGLMVATAESCTAGMIAKMMTDVPGSSKYFERGVVTYSNESKMELLGVKEKTLIDFGAVSEQTAGEMAEGIKKKSRADICIAVTGIAGPDGGTAEKHVGTVFIGLCDEFGTIVKKYKFGGQRDQIRKRAALEALNLIRMRLNDKNFYSD